MAVGELTELRALAKGFRRAICQVLVEAFAPSANRNISPPSWNGCQHITVSLGRNNVSAAAVVRRIVEVPSVSGLPPSFPHRDKARASELSLVEVSGSLAITQHPQRSPTPPAVLRGARRFGLTQPGAIRTTRTLTSLDKTLL